MDAGKKCGKKLGEAKVGAWGAMNKGQVSVRTNEGHNVLAKSVSITIHHTPITAM